MVFSLILHSSHQDQPEKVGLFIVSACNHLMFNERVLYFFIVSVLSFVISDQNECRIEASNQLTDKEVSQGLVIVGQDHVVDADANQFNLFYDLFLHSSVVLLLILMNRISISSRGIHKGRLCNRA